jgi:uncharacterized protein
MLTGEHFDYCCHPNLTRAVAPHGLTEFDIHDVLNVFQCTGLNHSNKYFMRRSSAKAGDYLEFLRRSTFSAHCRRALAVIYLKPYGAGSAPPHRHISAAGDYGIRFGYSLLSGWESPRVASYDGFHGLQVKTGHDEQPKRD